MAPAAAAGPCATLEKRTGFIDHQVAAEKILAVQELYGTLSFFMAGNFNEAKAPRLPGKAVANEGDFLDLNPA